MDITPDQDVRSSESFSDCAGVCRHFELDVRRLPNHGCAAHAREVTSGEHGGYVFKAFAEASRTMALAGLLGKVRQGDALGSASLALAALTLLACVGACSLVAQTSSEPAASPLTRQERQCVERGWQRETPRIGALERRVLWKAPPGAWPRGAIIVLHGGGGSAANFCVSNIALTAPQVRFTEAALAAGFAVFLLDSSDVVTDTDGRLCGKVWDDEVRSRANLDLPFIGHVLDKLIPAHRPAMGRHQIFVVGHSSGGYMTARVATSFPERISAFGLVASGDPYGWYRDCTARANDRRNVFGAGFDSETRRIVVEPGACRVSAYPNEKPWDGFASAARPPYRVFHHENDAIHDVSCTEKIDAQLRAHGYPGAAPMRLTGGGRALAWHFWLDAYNPAIVEYFSAFTR